MVHWFTKDAWLQSPLAPHESLLQNPVLQHLVANLSGPNPYVAEVAAVLLARCCGSKEEVSS